MAGVFLSACTFKAKACDRLFGRVEILTSLASTVPLCKWPPHVSENAEKQLLFSGCSLIRVYLEVKMKKVTLVWELIVLHDYRFMVIFMFEAFSAIDAACHDSCQGKRPKPGELLSVGLSREP